MKLRGWGQQGDGAIGIWEVDYTVTDRIYGIGYYQHRIL